MRQVIVRKGAVGVEDVPAPVAEPGTVLVRVEYSCVSAGTELSGIQSSAVPLWKRAVREPAKVRRVVDVAASQGFGAARQLVSGAAASGQVTGYSAAGVVMEVGSGIDDLRPGDRVACAGAQAAHHAQVIRVPRNLVVSVPDGVTSPAASTVTLGAIALQGVRRASPTMGETFVVIGLGVIGQLTAQLLKANGCQVIGTDLDPSRVRIALELGMDMALAGGLDTDVDQVERLTDGIGADGVIITAASSSDEIVSTAFRMCRRKGRVVLVGDVGLDLDRADIYPKELDFLVSTSYGPGRYDEAYEEHGLDYPVGYVRWTENRNMAEYLRLLAAGRVRVEPLVGATFALDQASDAYEALRSGSPRPVIALLQYPEQSAIEARRVVVNRIAQAKSGTIGIAVIGAGSFAKGMHLPNIRAMGDGVRLQAVVSRSGPGAVDTARQFGASYATTDLHQVLADDAVDLVIITTRHDTHAQLVLDALRAGKHVLVEKPLALTREELDEVSAFFDETANQITPVLMTGFNRRFSAYGQRIAELTAKRVGPMMLDYRMNAGYIKLDHWVHGPEGGGRNLGEACHIYDLFTYLADAPVARVDAQAIRSATDFYGPTDNFAVMISFEDGSVCSLTYTALGSPAHPKERLDVYVDGQVISLDDYRSLTVAGASSLGLKTSASEKGQRQELETLVRAIREGGEWPIPLWQQVQATDIALRVQDLITGHV
jgi:predicted dehydrogenase/threonine dehydrogenase-like Zn-dependent dehydrogenase